MERAVRELFEKFPEPTLAYGVNGEQVVCRAVNTTFEEVFDTDAENAEGCPITELISPTGDDETVVETCLESSERDCEVERETSSGAATFRLRTIPVEESDRVNGFAVYTDITAQKQREEKLRERETELERQKENLQQQKSQLEYQNERLDRFASIVSHDLRNPLNVARGRLDILLTRLENAETGIDPEHGKQVSDSLKRMEDIIEDALTLAREGKAITDTTEVPLEEVVQESWRNVDTMEATLECCEPVAVESDPNRLPNVFENLFRNAVEHGRSDATIRVELLEDGFYIADDGPGIDDDHVDSVFEEGFTTSSQGTGFGLAIVEDVVRAHGWEIAVTESVDGGARFEITNVTFSWTTDDIVAVLSETLGFKRASELVAGARDDLNIERPQFDRATAIHVLDAIACRDDVSSLGRVAAQTAMRQIESDI